MGLPAPGMRCDWRGWDRRVKPSTAGRGYGCGRNPRAKPSTAGCPPAVDGRIARRGRVSREKPSTAGAFRPPSRPRSVWATGVDGNNARNRPRRAALVPPWTESAPETVHGGQGLRVWTEIMLETVHVGRRGSRRGRILPPESSTAGRRHGRGQNPRSKPSTMDDAFTVYSLHLECVRDASALREMTCLGCLARFALVLGNAPCSFCCRKRVVLRVRPGGHVCMGTHRLSCSAAILRERISHAGQRMKPVRGNRLAPCAEPWMLAIMYHIAM